jgi:hypothetical protein
MVGSLCFGGRVVYIAAMPAQPPDYPTRIVIARPPRKRPRPVLATVASPVRIVYAPKQKQRDAWARYLALTGQDE